MKSTSMTTIIHYLHFL